MRRDPYRAQAEKFRQKIERVEPKPEPEIEQRRTLPKRSELHQEKKTKIKYPLIKGMLAFFVLLPILMFGIYTSLDHKQNENRSIVTEKGQREEVTYESRDIEEEVKSGTSSNEVNETAEGQESAPKPESIEEAQPAVQQQPPAEEVDEESLVQLTEQSEPVQKTEFQENVQVIDHVVKPKETLFRIAMNYYNSQAGMEKIKEWNNIETHDLEAGQVLKIPLPVD
jgi:LysM repeat protein